MSEPEQRVRLARAFGIDPLPAGTAMLAGGGFAVFGLVTGPIGLLPTAGLVAAYAIERVRIASGLREVQRWGFPVEGYRAWLLARQPAFELEVRAPVGSDLVERAFAAVDPAITVKRCGPRAVRVVTPRVRIVPDGGGPEVVVGDRTLLAAIHERVLAPLHADVGIVAMRMGDRATLAGAGEESRRDDASEVTFRDPAMAAPPALQALVHAGTVELGSSRDARRVSLRADRVLHAAGELPTPPVAIAAPTTIGAAILGSMIAGAAGGWIGAGVGLVAGIASVVGIDRSRAAGVTRSLGPLDFPVEGYDSWLISARPVIDVELRAAADPVWLASLVRRVPCRLTSLGERLLRIETDPCYVRPGGEGVPPFWGGNRWIAKDLVARLLVPLHECVGIAAVRMGGFVDPRE